jgi:hypothetical protein
MTKKGLFQSLKEYPSISFGFEKCFGLCDSGIEFLTRNAKSFSCQGATIQQGSCSFPCANKTGITTAQGVVDALISELSKGGFINDVVYNIFGTNITIVPSSKRASGSVGFFINPCGNSSEIFSLVYNLSREVVPNAPNLVTSVSNCSSEISSTDPQDTSQNLLAIIIPSVLGAVVLLILIALISLWKYYSTRNRLHLLPEEIAWSFKLYEKESISSWDIGVVEEQVITPKWLRKIRENLPEQCKY